MIVVHPAGDGGAECFVLACWLASLLRATCSMSCKKVWKASPGRLKASCVVQDRGGSLCASLEKAKLSRIAGCLFAYPQAILQNGCFLSSVEACSLLAVSGIASAVAVAEGTYGGTYKSLIRLIIRLMSRLMGKGISPL